MFEIKSEPDCQKKMFDELLIQKVKNNECLYNILHKDYRNFNIRQAIWEEIGKELQIPGTAAKEHWDKLRRCYTNARSRHRDSKLGAKRRVVWKFEEQMSFILPFVGTKKTRNNVINIGNESQDDGEDSPDFEFSQSNQIAINIDEHYDNNAVEEHELQMRNKRKASVQHSLDDSLQETATSREEKKYKEKSQGFKYLAGLDDMDMFFLSMSKMTKKLPKLEQARIKLQISNLVLTAEMQDHQQNYSKEDQKHYFEFVQPCSYTEFTRGSSTPKSTASNLDDS